MSREVWKYELEPPGEGRTDLALPRNSIPRHVGIQDHVLCIWIEQDPTPASEAEEIEEHAYYAIGTGWMLPTGHAQLDYIGTIFQGPFVWHVYRGL